jgi:hypothetical protein
MKKNAEKTEQVAPEQTAAEQTDQTAEQTPSESGKNYLAESDFSLEEAVKMLDLDGFLGEFYNPDGTPIGKENDEGDQIRKPYLRLGQPTSKIGNAGKFYNNVTKEEKEVIRTAIFFPKTAAVKFPEKYDSKSKPLCRSEDGIINTDGTMKCANCPDNYNKFGPDGKRPNCSKVVGVAGWDLDDNNFFILPLRGKALTSFTDFKSEITWNRNKAPYFFFETQISAKFVKDDKGNYWIPMFTITRDYTDELKQLTKEVSDAVKNKDEAAAKVSSARLKTLQEFLLKMKKRLQDIQDILITDIIADEMRQTGAEEEYEESNTETVETIHTGAPNAANYEKGDNDSF